MNETASVFLIAVLRPSERPLRRDCPSGLMKGLPRSWLMEKPVPDELPGLRRFPTRAAAEAHAATLNARAKKARSQLRSKTRYEVKEFTEAQLVSLLDKFDEWLGIGLQLCEEVGVEFIDNDSECRCYLPDGVQSMSAWINGPIIDFCVQVNEVLEDIAIKSTGRQEMGEIGRNAYDEGSTEAEWERYRERKKTWKTSESK